MAVNAHRLLAAVGVRLYQVAEESMSPALSPGDGLVTVALRRPRRGRLVVLEHPERSGFVLVKRIVGLPGEEVTITDGRVMVDGDVLAEPWARGHPGRDGAWTVPHNRLFVLSDARELTRSDSRSFGPQPTAGVRRVVRVARRPGRPPG